MKRLPPPKKCSLVQQCANAIQDGINRKIWQSYLPNEHVLSIQLQVSRPTLRKALKMLHHQKIIFISHGKKTKILAPSQSGNSRYTPMIGVLLEYNDQNDPVSSPVINALRNSLHDADLDMVLFPRKLSNFRQPDAILQNLVASNPEHQWILISCPAKVQSWFIQNSIPALVIGTSAYPKELPSIDVDYRAVCRHATGILLSKNHSHIGLLLPKGNIGGDKASEQGFREAILATNRSEVIGTTLLHNGTPEGICHVLMQQIKCKRLPTALLIAKPADVLTAISFLQTNGIRIPQDISIISRDWEPLLSAIIPTLAGYQFNLEKLAKHAVEMLLQNISQTSLIPPEYRLMPTYKPAASVSSHAIC